MWLVAAAAFAAVLQRPAGAVQRCCPSKPRMSDGSPPLRPRTIQVDESLSVTVFEIAKPKELVELWMGAGSNDGVGAFATGTRPECDPFGVVLWPGAQLAAQILSAHSSELGGRTVCTLGVGTGLEALAAAKLGAKRVIACDNNPLVLSLLAEAAEYAGLDQIISCLNFDLFATAPLPECDVLVAADVLYNRPLAGQLGRRCHEGISRARPISALVVTDSQRFHSGDKDDFMKEINREPLGGFEWTPGLVSFTGSGILLDEDQSYEAETRFVSWWGGKQHGVEAGQAP